MDLSGLSDHLKAVESKDSITLPWKGVEYVIAPPGQKRRLRCAALFAAYTREGAEKVAAIAEALDGEPMEDVVLGADAAARMHDDDVHPKVIGHLCTVAMIAWVQGEAAAQRYLDSSAAGEPGPKEPARSKRSRTGTSTGAASTTKRRASTSGTKPRRSASPRPAAKVPGEASTGGTSSPAGTSS
jgi:hypothetical protein